MSLHNEVSVQLREMQCPKCGSKHICKNGMKCSKQNHICVDCGRQFISPSEQTKA